MKILLILIPVALLIITIAGCFFFWAIRTKQFDDLDRQGANILFDDEPTPASKINQPPIVTTNSDE